MGDHLHSPAEERRIREAALDETLAGTFPASDPPSSIPNPYQHVALIEPGEVGGPAGPETSKGLERRREIAKWRTVDVANHRLAPRESICWRWHSRCSSLDRGLRHPSRGASFREIHTRGRDARDGATLGEPACAGQRTRPPAIRRCSAAISRPCPCWTTRACYGRRRGHLRGTRRSGAHVLANGCLGCADACRGNRHLGIFR